MVLFAEPNEEDVERLRRRRRLRFAYLYNALWDPPVTVGFRSIESSGEKSLYMDIELAADAAWVVYYTYFHRYISSPFSLDIGDGYYTYDLWCVRLIFLLSGEFSINICRSRNFYDYRELGARSLKPPSFYTVVPTQLSSLI